MESWKGKERVAPKNGPSLIFGDYGHRSDESCSGQTTPDGILAVGGDAE